MWPVWHEKESGSATTGAGSSTCLIMKKQVDVLFCYSSNSQTVPSNRILITLSGFHSWQRPLPGRQAWQRQLKLS